MSWVQVSESSKKNQDLMRQFLESASRFYKYKEKFKKFKGKLYMIVVIYSPLISHLVEHHS